MFKNQHITLVLSLLILVAATLAAYSNSFNGPFVFDDYHNILENEYLKIEDLSFNSLKNAAIKGPSKDRWIPKISFALNYYFAEKKIGGGYGETEIPGHGFAEPDTWDYHLVNFLIHIATAICLFFLFKITLASKLLKAESRHINEVALFAALIWAVHPVQTNAVNYIVQRMTSMAAMFFVASLLFYVLGRIQERVVWKGFFFLLCLLAGISAIFSKENSAILPFVILAYEFFFLGGLCLSARYKTHAFVVVLAVFMVIGIGWFYLGGNPFSRLLSGYDVRDFTIVERLLTQPRVLMQYLSLLAFPLPSRLNLAYDFPVSANIFSPLQTFPALLGIAIVTFLVFFLFRRDRLFSFALFWFLVNLAIESSVIPIEIIFEHRMYLPSAFLLLVLVAMCYRMGVRRPNLVRVLFSIIVCLLMFFTWQRNQTWASRENIWGDVSEKSPGITRGHIGLFITLKTQGRDEEAMQVLQKALKADPTEFKPVFYLAYVYKEEKKYKEALLVLNDMFKLEHMRKPTAYNLRATIYLELKNYQMAINDSLKALEIDPQHINSLLVLGAAYFRQNNFPQAAAYYEKARELSPNTYEIYFNLGTTYFNLGKYDKAIANYRVALNFAPNNADIHYNLGMVYGAKGMIKEMQQEITLSRRLKGELK